METTRVLRPRLTPEEKKIQTEIVKAKKEVVKPFITYKGKTSYTTTFIDCAAACDDLLKMANNCKDDIFVIGFDMEWPFNFQTGPGKTAVIQISPNLSICYIFHVSEIKSLPKGLSDLLVHPKVRITGVNIKNDIRKLARDFSGFDGDLIVQKAIDTGVFANTILPTTQRWSMEKLVNYVLDKRINKNKKVRMSKWHVIPLSKAQQVYAAIDAYASLLLYFELKAREKLLDKEQDQNKINTD